MALSNRGKYQLSQIISLLFEMSDGHNVDLVLSTEEDLQPSVKRHGDVSLKLKRSFQSKISSRYETGPMGKGWMIEFWDTKIVNVTDQDANLTIAGETYSFSRMNDTLFRHPRLGNLIIETVNQSFVYVFKDTAAGLKYRFSSEHRQLKSVQSLQDNSEIIFIYNNTKLATMRHSNGPFLQITYNKMDRISSVELKNDTSQKQISSYEYDYERDRLISTNVNGITTKYEYNSDNSIKTIIYPNGQKETFQYYEEGWLRARELLINNTVIGKKMYEFDGGATVTTHIYPQNRTTTFSLDVDGTVATRKQAGLLTERWERNKNSLVEYQGDYLISSKTYDETSNTVLVKDANGDFLQISYTDLGQIKNIIDINENAYSVSYNTNATINSVKYPDNTTEVYGYGPNLQTFTSRSSEQVRYTFDESGNIIVKDLGNDRLSFYSYDSKRRLTTATSEIGSTLFGYSLNDMPEYVKLPTNVFVNYTYNANLQKDRIKLSLPGYDVKYYYNDKNLLTKVTNMADNKVLLKVEYNEKMQLKRKVLGNNAYTTYSYYSDSDLLKGVYNYFPNGNLSSKFEYIYDTRERRISLKTTSGIWQFRYDPSGQLTFVRKPDGSATSFDYDKRKNRKTVVKDSVRQTYTLNGLNQYTSFGQNETFKYDKNGNLISKDGENREYYKFNSQNDLLEFENVKDRCGLLYDGVDNLMQQNCGEKYIEYVVDMFGAFGSDVLSELVRNGEKEERTFYFHGGDQIGLVAMKNKNGYFYYQFDPLGSVVGLLNAKGILVNSYQYEPFGNLTHQDEQVRNPFTFIGKWGVMQMTNTKHLFYMRARFYDSEHGRFLSMDPMGIEGNSKNFYVYVYNNPVHFADPKGKFVNCLIAGAIDTAIYYGVNWLTDQKVTFAGAAKAFVSGAVGECFGPILGVLAGELTKVVIENVIQDKPFDINEVKDDLISDLRSRNDGRVKKLFDRFKNWLTDPTKSCDEKLSAAKTTFSKLGISIKLEHCSDIPKIGDKIIHWIRSHDPNDIVGPTGYGAAHFIRKGLKMDFKIRFENDENATAPAQRVTVEYKIDENIDMRTFRLGSFGFGNYVYEMKDAASSVQVKVNLTQTYGVFVRVKGGLDIVNKKATWEFQTIDPNTGMAPDDPRKGFLPPNNGTSGQGFVTFSVYPKKGAYTLARINVQGTIYFDQNEPIDTPLLFYTIDNTPPDINCTVVKEMLQSEILAVNLEATDKGSGFSFTDIFLKRESGYEMILTGATSTIITLPLLPGETYELLFIPVDFTGNRHTIQNVDSSNLLKIDFPKVKGSCDHLNNCSENGNCTSNNICVCNGGFFGTDCSLDTAPLEPPILETQDVVGWEDSPIPLFLFAKVLNGTVYDIFQIIIRNYPAHSKFTTGTESGNHWEINSMELGNISFIPPSDTSGHFQLEITGLLKYGVLNASRTNVVNLIIKPVIDGVDIDLQAGCFDIKRGAALIKLKMNQRDLDFSERVKLMIELPEQYAIRNSNKTNDGMYKIENPNITSIFEVCRLNNSAEFVPINVTLFFIVSEIGTSNTISYNRSEIIRQCEAPPVITCISGSGDEDTPILLFIDAISPNYTLQSFRSIVIVLDGYPMNSSFSQGKQEDKQWLLSEKEFGNISYLPPRDFSGNFSLNILAYGLSNTKNLTSVATIDITINPVIDGVNIQVAVGCYKSASKNISVSIAMTDLDSDGSETGSYFVQVPPSFMLNQGVSISRDTYKLTKNEIGGSLNLHYLDKYPPVSSEMTLTVTGEIWEKNFENKPQVYKEQSNIRFCTEKQQYSVNITMRINLTLTGDLNNKSYYKKVYRDTEMALTQYYFNATQIKDVFLRIILYSIRNGSLIADHSVLTSEESKQNVQNVLNDLTLHKRKLKIAGQEVQVLQANIEDSISNPNSHGLTKLQRLSIIISCSVVAFLVFLCVALLIRNRRRSNHKTKEQECHPGESLKLVKTSHQHDTGPKQLIEMTVQPFKIPRPKIKNDYENYGFMHS